MITHIDMKTVIRGRKNYECFGCLETIGKGNPSIILKEKNGEKLENIIFRETTTIGIRRQKMDRTVLRRSKKTVQTPYGEAEVKICEKDGMKKVYPEYESVVRLCKESEAAFQDVFESVKQAIEK